MPGAALDVYCHGQVQSAYCHHGQELLPVSAAAGPRAASGIFERIPEVVATASSKAVHTTFGFAHTSYNVALSLTDFIATSPEVTCSLSWMDGQMTPTSEKNAGFSTAFPLLK
uniref:Uncharacterized protein n=1 Tax=Sphaerodactylus townsendi TaxID=933632 RepID=A0ACB8G4J5_9SAUR